MLFNSLVFLGFLAVVLLVYPRLPFRGQNVFLLIASYVFYGYWDWRFAFLLLFTTVLDFWVARQMQASESPARRRGYLLVSVLVNLGILGFFKYFNFFVDTAAALLHGLGLEPNLPVLRVILPVGVSFYTFQSMSYVIDVYRRDLTATSNLIDFALYVSFFPQLVAGPIERATNLLPQVSNPRKVTRDDVVWGLNLALLGYFKKVVIADTLAPIVDSIFRNPQGHDSGQLLAGILAFSFQIYGDFAGYTDIARGVARLMGFRIMENFNTPYLSRSITEFWRRWHISLSTWLRDYLYIPLGGNRRGKVRTYVNLVLTMFLGGLWHGASWHFVVWGLLHGGCLSAERILRLGTRDDGAWPRTVFGRLLNVARLLGTFALVGLTWVFFRSRDVATSLAYLRGLFRFDRILDVAPTVLIAGAFMVTLDILHAVFKSPSWLSDRVRPLVLRYGLGELLLAGVVAAAIAQVNTVIPFIYFQF